MVTWKITTLLKDEESALDNHVLDCNFAKYLIFLLRDLAINRRHLKYVCLHYLVIFR